MGLGDAFSRRAPAAEASRGTLYPTDVTGDIDGYATRVLDYRSYYALLLLLLALLLLLVAFSRGVFSGEALFCGTGLPEASP